MLRAALGLCSLGLGTLGPPELQLIASVSGKTPMSLAALTAAQGDLGEAQASTLEDTDAA